MIAVDSKEQEVGTTFEFFSMGLVNTIYSFCQNWFNKILQKLLPKKNQWIKKERGTNEKVAYVWSLKYFWIVSCFTSQNELLSLNHGWDLPPPHTHTVPPTGICRPTAYSLLQKMMGGDL